MRGEYAAVHTAIADDPAFKLLSPAAKCCWYTLRMMLGASGIDLVRASVTVLGDATGLAENDLRGALDELVGGEWLYASGDVLWLRNVLRFNPHMSLKNGKHVTSISRHLAGLPKCPLVNGFADYYGLPTPFPDSLCDRVSDTYAIQDIGHRTTDIGIGAVAKATEGEPSAGGPSFGDVMAVVRTELCPTDKDEQNRSGNILRRDYAGRVPPLDVIDACRGARRLIDAGKVDGIAPGSSVGLRFLRKWRADDGRLLWDAALENERYAAKQAGKRGGQPSRISVALEPRGTP